jgi:hypothetical protein
MRMRFLATIAAVSRTAIPLAMTAFPLAPAPAPLQAQTAGNVLVVINDVSEISRKVGEYYASRRNIPGRNLCRIEVTDSEEVSRQVYERDVQTPVGECLQRGLKEQILYIVTTTGVPLKIEGRGGMQGDAASVDSELTLLYERLEGKSPPIDGPARNPFFGKLADKFEHPAFPFYLVTRLAGYDLGARHRSGRWVEFLVCGRCLSVIVHPEQEALCHKLCPSWKSSAPRYCSNSIPLAIFAPGRSVLSLAAVENQLATAPNPTTQGTIPRFA